MQIDHLWLVDFRNYVQAEMDISPTGLTVVTGDNGQGKTNLIEALAYLSRLESFRGVGPDVLVRVGSQRAVVRAQGLRQDRRLLLEAEIVAGGRNRVQINRQPLRRARDLLGAIRTSVFSPDDLDLIKGGPVQRRRFLDETIVSLRPLYDTMRLDLDRVLRQRGVLLKQARGHLTSEIAASLDVWDTKLAHIGEAVASERSALVSRLAPEVAKHYATLSGGGASGTGLAEPELVYVKSWDGDLASALLAGRGEDLRRAGTSKGPHRDELAVSLASMPARSHASQGEQRCLALALRLAAHAVVTEEVGSAPVLLLDDVFSELDEQRSAALVEHLPSGQTLLTTAGPLPVGVDPDLVVRVRSGQLVGE